MVVNGLSDHKNLNCTDTSCSLLMVSDPTRALCFPKNGHHIDNKDQNTLYQILRIYSNPSIDTSLTCGPHKNLYLLYHSQGSYFTIFEVTFDSFRLVKEKLVSTLRICFQPLPRPLRQTIT